MRWRLFTRGLFALATLVWAGGCFGGGDPLPSALPEAAVVPDARRLDDLAEERAEATTAAERLSLAAAALRASGVAPLADARVPGASGQYIVGREGTTLAGWIAGRIPLRSDSLVVVSAPRDGLADLALIEAARMVAARGAYTQTPARTILFVLGDDIDAPLQLWSRSQIAAVLRADARGPDSLAGHAVRYISPEGPAPEVAARLYAAIAEAATPPSPYLR